MYSLNSDCYSIRVWLSCIVVMTKIKTFSNQNEVSLDVIYVRE